MKLCIAIVAFAGCLCLAFNATTFGSGGAPFALQSKTPQDAYKLSTDSKKDKAKSLPVTFSHVNHSTKNYSPDGTRPITCVECHHTDQPAAEAAKRPPLKTAHPADRTATLTAELLKDASAPGVNTCRSCHAQEDATPKIGSAIPEITYEGESDPVLLTNEEAFHRNCAGCHDAAADARKGLKLPTANDCKGCHTGQ